MHFNALNFLEVNFQIASKRELLRQQHSQMLPLLESLESSLLAVGLIGNFIAS